MNKFYFITDLDRTIIHSKNKGFLCVEKMNNREITYMTEYSYDKLQCLLKQENFQFIPCTMRNINQTLRVDFIKEYNPEIIICTNGAQIYINGKLDEQWDKIVKSEVDFNEVEDDIKYLKSFNLQWEEVRNIEGFYITVKFESQSLAQYGYDLIKDMFQGYKKVLLIGVKIFIINEKINKLKAVDYIIEKFNMKNVITSGDTEVDREFTQRGSSILPKHSSFNHDYSIITKNHGIHSTDEILDFISNYIKI